jgi:hypothetical protein
MPGPFNERDRTELYSEIAKEINNKNKNWITN